ncbi:MAG: hypothetical protein ACREDI_03305, partial [Roseiarcus sp.]
MTMFRFGPLLAIGGAACLVAWTPEGRPPPPEVTPLDLASGPRFDATPTETASVNGAAPAAVSVRGPEPARSDADLAAQFAYADVPPMARAPAVSAGSASSASAEAAAVPAPPPEPALSDADLAAQFAYADLPGIGPPAASALSGAEPSTPAAPAPSPALPQASPLSSEAAILYTKGDVAGLIALAVTANDAAERTALEWASLRADPHPSFASLAAFLEAHPGWPSRGWIRERQEAELAAHAEPPAKVAAYFAGDPPQSSAGKIAAARAAQATGRSEEASQIIRALWRDGNFDSPTETVILREFGASLTKADHTYRADRLFYAGYPGAGARAAALAGPEVLALAAARIAAARAPISAALVKAVPLALRNDPGLLFSRIQYARRAGRVYEAAVMLSLAPHDRAALVDPDRWWSERKMVALQLLDLDEPRLAFEVCVGTVRPDSSE